MTESFSAAIMRAISCDGKKYAAFSGKESPWFGGNGSGAQRKYIPELPV